MRRMNPFRSLEGSSSEKISPHFWANLTSPLHKHELPLATIPSPCVLLDLHTCSDLRSRPCLSARSGVTKQEWWTVFCSLERLLNKAMKKFPSHCQNGDYIQSHHLKKQGQFQYWKSSSLWPDKMFHLLFKSCKDFKCKITALKPTNQPELTF